MKEVRSFKDLNVQVETARMEGNKVQMSDVLNVLISIHGFKNEPSKFNGKNPVCTHLQISIAGVKHVLFSGSKTIQKIMAALKPDDFPFTTTIKPDGKGIKFT